MSREDGITDLNVFFTWEGRSYFFNVDDMKRNLTDGGGNPIFATDVIRDDGMHGVVNLTPDWKVTHIYMNYHC